MSTPPTALADRLLHPRRWSIRARLTAVATVLVGLVLAVAGLVLIAVQDRQLRAGLDDTLSLRADSLAAEIDRAGTTAVGVDRIGGDDRPVQIVSLDGEVLAASDGLGSAPVAPPPSSRQVLRSFDGLPIDDDDGFRVLSRRIDSPSGPVVLHVGQTTEELSDNVRTLAASLAATLPFLVLLLGLVVWWLVGRALRPVEAIRSEVAAIGGRGLHRRVPTPATDDEIARLASTMNRMLDRLEESSRRQQRFVADASHELRSPLTRIRTEVEVALGRDRSRSDGTLGLVLDETIELERLVADLLHLARSDAGITGGDTVPVDLDDVVYREARRLRAAGHTVDLDRLSAAQVMGRVDHLTRLVRNLLDNAARHASHAVTVVLTEAEDDHGTTVARLEVIDDGPGVAPADRDRIFERFTRLDDARSRDAGGAGLGLAIARDVADAHGGSITVADDQGGSGARFVVILPASPG